MMNEDSKLEFQQLIRAELNAHKPTVSPKLVKWLIGTFSIFILGLVFTAGTMFTQFNILKRNMIPKTEFEDVKYQADYLWAERFDMPLPHVPLRSNGGGVLTITK